MPWPRLPGDSGGFGSLPCRGERRRQRDEGRSGVEKGALMCQSAGVAQGDSGAAEFILFLYCPTCSRASSRPGRLCPGRAQGWLAFCIGLLWLLRADSPSLSSGPSLVPAYCLTDNDVLVRVFELTETKGKSVCFSLALASMSSPYLVRPEAAERFPN